MPHQSWATTTTLWVPPSRGRPAGTLRQATTAAGLGFLPAPPYIKLRRHVFGVATMSRRPRDLADRMSRRRKPEDGFVRETFTLPRLAARAKARQFLDSYPAAAYMSKVE